MRRQPQAPSFSQSTPPILCSKAATSWPQHSLIVPPSSSRTPPLAPRAPGGGNLQQLCPPQRGILAELPGQRQGSSPPRASPLPLPPLSSPVVGACGFSHPLDTSGHGWELPHTPPSFSSSTAHGHQGRPQRTRNSLCFPPHADSIAAVMRRLGRWGDMRGEK